MTRPRAVQSERQRVIVITFTTPAEALEWDELTDDAALASLAVPRGAAMVRVQP